MQIYIQVMIHMFIIPEGKGNKYFKEQQIQLFCPCTLQLRPFTNATFLLHTDNRGKLFLALIVYFNVPSKRQCEYSLFYSIPQATRGTIRFCTKTTRGKECIVKNDGRKIYRFTVDKWKIIDEREETSWHIFHGFYRPGRGSSAFDRSTRFYYVKTVRVIRCRNVARLAVIKIDRFSYVNRFDT